MSYDRARFRTDRNGAWKNFLPHIKKGLKSPFIAGKSGKALVVKRELGVWLRSWGQAALLLAKLAFYGVRLLLNK